MRYGPEPDWGPRAGLAQVQSGVSSAAGALLFALVLEVPDADGDAEDGEEEFAKGFDSVLVVGLPNGVAGDANAGEDKVPPFPSFSLLDGIGSLRKASEGGERPVGLRVRFGGWSGSRGAREGGCQGWCRCGHSNGRRRWSGCNGHAHGGCG